MTQDPNNEKHYIADEGRTFIRIVSGEDLGTELWLGYSYIIGGEIQDPPHLDVIEDFEEAPIPEPEEPEGEETLEEPELPENQEVNEESSELPEEEQPS